MRSFDCGPAGVVLDRLFAAADAGDPGLLTTLPRTGFTAAEKAAVYKDVYMPVSREVGRFLYMLARAQRSRTIVEFGASFGISTIHLAAAIRDNGSGRVITTELNPDKARRARENLAEAGLVDLVEVREGDALQTLKDIDTEVDLMLLDGWKDLYLPVLRLVESRLTMGAIVIADDMDLFPEATKPYLEYVRDPSSGYTSVLVNMGDGLELSVRSET